MIYKSKECIFGLCFWHWAPKTLGISCDKSNKCVFCYVNEVTLGMPLGNKSWGLVARRTNRVFRGLEISVPSPDLWEGERGWRLSSIANDQWFNQLCLCNEASIKSWRTGLGKLPCWWTRGGLGRVACSERAWELRALSPYLGICISSIWLFLIYILL